MSAKNNTTGLMLTYHMGRIAGSDKSNSNRVECQNGSKVFDRTIRDAINKKVGEYINYQNNNGIWFGTSLEGGYYLLGRNNNGWEGREKCDFSFAMMEHSELSKCMNYRWLLSLLVDKEPKDNCERKVPENLLNWKEQLRETEEAMDIKSDINYAVAAYLSKKTLNTSILVPKMKVFAPEDTLNHCISYVLAMSPIMLAAGKPVPDILLIKNTQQEVYQLKCGVWQFIIGKNGQKPYVEQDETATDGLVNDFIFRCIYELLEQSSEDVLGFIESWKTDTRKIKDVKEEHKPLAVAVAACEYMDKKGIADTNYRPTKTERDSILNLLRR